MSRKGRKANRKRPRRQETGRRPRQPEETRAADVITVAWTVSITAVLLSNLAAVAAHLYSIAVPDAGRTEFLKTLMLFSACAIGVVCLALIPVVYRVRRVPPPFGIVLFAVLISAAPILTIVARQML